MKNVFGKAFRGLAARLFFSCLAAFSVLAVCSKSSFLYPMNDWVDVNCFFTVGRGILHGLVPYRDLYEQKGPLVYFLFALAGRISENSFLGVWLLEGLCFACFLHLGGKLAETLSGRKGSYWVSVPALAVLIPVTPAFSHGASAEEFFLPFLALGLYTVLKAMHEKRPLSDAQGFVLGLCAACALWTKYTFCGLYLGLALGVLIWYPASGNAGRLSRLMGMFMLGFLALSAAVLGWFALRNALPDLWQAYFVNNLSRYSQNIRGGRYAEPLPNLLNNLPWSVPGVLGLVWLTVCARKRGWEALAAWLGAAGLFIFTYWSERRYPYYALVLAVFAPLGMAAASALAGRLARHIKPARTAVAAGVFGCILLLAGPFIAFRATPNAYLMSFEKEDMPQYRFAGIIAQSEDRTLLNYGFLDGGFYYAAGVQPSGPFFCTLNISLPDMEEALENSVRQGETAFVVTRARKLKGSVPYRLVDEADMVFEGRNWHYYLYQRED